jgi:NADPH:quinone reductase-like Zn-dependent oxidoreductase
LKNFQIDVFASGIKEAAAEFSFPRDELGAAAVVSAGTRVIALSSSKEKLRHMRDLGAVAGINYRVVPNWEEVVLELTNGEGVDHVVEVGGAGTLARSFRAARYGAMIGFIGVLTGLEGTVDPLPILLKGLRLIGVSVGPRDVLEEMNVAIGDASLRPVIDSVFDFEQARDAMKHIESGAHFGKIVIRI